jgi:hypothetical protein
MRAFLLVLAFIATAHSLAFSQAAPKCLDVLPKALNEGEILYLFSSETEPGMLESLILFNGSEFKETNNRYFRGITEVFQADNGKSAAVSYDTYSVLPGSDQCFWTAKLEKSKKNNELFTFPKSKLNTKVDEQIQAQFYSINKACIDQLDANNNPKTPCTKPILKGVSDLNKNGRPEFWYTAPHPRNTGFAVAELDESGSTLKVIVEK